MRSKKKRPSPAAAATPDDLLDQVRAARTPPTAEQLHADIIAVHAALQTSVPPVREHEGGKYLRLIHPADGVGEPIWVDVYEVIAAWEVTCPGMQQGIKKLLACGQRGKGDKLADLMGCLAAVNRSVDMEKRRQRRRPK